MSSPPAVATGTVLAERYVVDGVLGEGGMGIVYRAEHVHMRKRVALKVLLPQWTSTPEVVARFEREAVAAGAIEHPNVAAATDFGRLADGSFFLVLEYIEGRTLRSELAAGPIAPPRALAILREILLGVGAAHAKGIVHRDLKPENVMLVARDGNPDFVKVLDFGIARLEGPTAASGPALTSAGAILGTPDYMAPEQIVGGRVDARADLYAVGVMLFEMLSGECPFRGGVTTVMRQHLLNAPPELPPDIATRVPESLRALVARAMHKEADARFANAAELLAGIEAAQAQMTQVRAIERAPTAVAATGPEGALPPWRAMLAQARGRKNLLGAVAIIGALVVVLATIGLGGKSETSAPEPAPYIALPAPTPASRTPPPAATAETPRASLPAPSAPAPSASTSASASAPSRRGRRTGPGGIYVPPPSTWFK